MTPRHDLLMYARSMLGKDLSFNAPNELGCADAVNEIARRVFGRPIGGGVSTLRMYQALEAGSRLPFRINPLFRFVRVKEGKHLPGDIIISPTGYGNGSVSNGHVGIMDANDLILSNNSVKGVWDDHFTLDTWKDRYQKRGGFPIFFYRVIRP